MWHTNFTINFGVTVYCLVSAQNQETCEDLDELITNVNPALLNNCFRDSSCTQVTCQTNKQLENFFASVTFLLVPCETPPGVMIMFFGDYGNALYQTLVVDTERAVLRAGNDRRTVVIDVSIESTPTALEITVSIFFNRTFLAIIITIICLSARNCEISLCV